MRAAWRAMTWRRTASSSFGACLSPMTRACALSFLVQHGGVQLDDPRGVYRAGGLRPGVRRATVAELLRFLPVQAIPRVLARAARAAEIEGEVMPQITSHDGPVGVRSKKE